MKAKEFLNELKVSLVKGFTNAATEYFLEPDEYNRGWKDAFELITLVVESNMEDIEE